MSEGPDISDARGLPRHGGTHAVAAARRHGVTTVFTLSGGHVFPVYDGAVKAQPPMRLLDVRHEQTAVFAAEGDGQAHPHAGLGGAHRRPGVTNGVSAIATAHFNGSPVVVLGGRAPDYRWGAGSLQELDHPPLLAPITKRAWTEHATAGIGAAVDEAFRLAGAPHRGPVFLDIPMDALFSEADAQLPGWEMRQPASPDPGAIAQIAGLLPKRSGRCSCLGPMSGWAGPRTRRGWRLRPCCCP